MAQAHGEEMNLREMFATLWAGRKIIIIGTFACAVIAAIVSVITPRTYRATVTVAPVLTNSAGGSLGGLGSLVSQFSGLASLAGISVGDMGGKAEAIAVLQSEALTEQYIAGHNLLPVLYPDLWDPEKQVWTTDSPRRKPTLWKANQYFKRKIRNVAEDKRTGLVLLTITWTDPALAAEWANDLVRSTNLYLREKKIAESERNIAYLNAEAAKTDVVQVRTAIYAILESEIKAAMVARGSEEYALKVVDPATPPEWPYSPKRVLWTIAGFFIGAVLSVVFVLLRGVWSEDASHR